MTLRESALRGVKWTSLSAIVGTVAGTIQPLVLAHLLGPRAFGLMAAVMVVMGICAPFTDLGVTQAIEVRKEVPRPVLSSLFWLNCMAGLVLAAIVFALAPVVAGFFGQHDLIRLVRWASLSFAITPLGATYRGDLLRRLRFDTVAKAEMVGAVSGFSLALGAALAGAGPIALVWGWLGSVCGAALTMFVQGVRIWRPTARFKRRDLDGYLSFGAYRMGESTINYLVANVDYVLIGRFLGTHALGIYSLAYQIAAKPLNQVNPILTRVATPVFAKRQDDDAALGRGLLEVTRMIGLVTMPLLTGLAVVAPVFVPVVLGHRWQAAVLPLQLLAFASLLHTLNNPIGSVFLAKNRPDLGFKINALYLPVIGGVLYVAVHLGGVNYVASAYLALCVVTSLFVTPKIMEWVIGLTLRDYIRELARPARLTLGMAAVATAAYFVLDALGASQAAVLAGSVVAGAAAYVGLLARYERSYLAELRRLVARRRAPAITVPEPAVG